MTSGKKFHNEEIEFVSQNMHDYPAVIARSLGLYFSEHNGGFRNTKSVSTLMNKIRTKRDPNSPDLPEDEQLEPNTLMKDLPAVKEVPKVSVAAVPTAKVAAIGTTVKENSQPTKPAAHVMAKKPNIPVKKKGK